MDLQEDGEDLYLWQGYWLVTLFDPQQTGNLVGILGVTRREEEELDDDDEQHEGPLLQLAARCYRRVERFTGDIALGRDRYGFM